MDLDTPEERDEETLPQPVSPVALAPDDDFDDEDLGERQPEACTMEPGCTTCE